MAKLDLVVIISFILTSFVNGQGNNSNETVETTTSQPDTNSTQPTWLNSTMTTEVSSTTEYTTEATTTAGWYDWDDECTNETHYYNEYWDCVPKGDDYEYENYGTFDASDDPSRNPAIIKMQKMSAVLSKTNSKCDGLIAAHLMANDKYKKTQPRIPQDIDIKLIIISLNGVNDAAQSISLTARIDFKWIDDRLILPNETCKGQNLLVRANELWFPYFTSMSLFFV